MIKIRLYNILLELLIVIEPKTKFDDVQKDIFIYLFEIKFVQKKKLVILKKSQQLKKPIS